MLSGADDRRQTPINLTIKRSPSSSTAGTFGLVAEIGIFTLELPWRNNIREHSCIPKGTYFLNLINSIKSSQFGQVYSLVNVPKRSGILIHTGNYLRQIKGCILIGNVIKMNSSKNEWEIYESKQAEKKLWNYTQGAKTCILKIE